MEDWCKQNTKKCWKYIVIILEINDAKTDDDAVDDTRTWNLYISSDMESLYITI